MDCLRANISKKCNNKINNNKNEIKRKIHASMLYIH